MGSDNASDTVVGCTRCELSFSYYSRIVKRANTKKCTGKEIDLICSGWLEIQNFY